MEINFQRLKDEVMESLRSKKAAVLATSSSDRVTARSKGKPLRDFLDLRNKRAHREYYDNTK